MAQCQDITVSLDNTGNVSITTNDIDNGSYDNCGIASITVSPNTFTCDDLGTNTVTLTVTDLNGNTDTCTATVTVQGYTFHDMDLPKGWSMISLPVVPDSLVLSDLFPEAVVVYRYEKGTGYVRVKNDAELVVGRGYWILLDQGKSYRLTGCPIQSYTHTASSDGWTMIGGCTQSAKVLPLGCDIGVIYGYAQGTGYQRVPASQPLEPGRGYWLLLNNATNEATISVKTVD